MQVSTGMVSRHYFLAPAWFLETTPQGLRVLNLTEGSALDLEGELSTLLHAQPAGYAALEKMAGFHPLLSRLAADLKKDRFRPLNRHAWLKGSGFSLLFIELTSRCNEACLHCYAESGPHRTEGLSEEILFQVLEDARVLSFRTVQFTGGDPLISPLLVPAVRKAHELGVPRTEIYTNGIALEGSLYAELTRYPVSFAFSFYSHRPEVHDAITRTAGSQRRTLNAIQRTLADGVPIRVGLVGMESNRGDLQDTMTMLADLGVPTEAMHVSYERGVGRGQVAQEPPVEKWPQVDPGSGSAHGGKSRGLFPGKACVSSDGRVFPCIFSRSISLGNVYSESLRDILTAPLPLTACDGDLQSVAACWADELSCWECRIRAALLAPDRAVSGVEP